MKKYIIALAIILIVANLVYDFVDNLLYREEEIVIPLEFKKPNFFVERPNQCKNKKESRFDLRFEPKK